ncbi:hypothetical protein DIPPA_21029 [Diplonema papillatum]|nr:hypothetical protein DIPPA_21029 [Diplonema papillatum]
MKPCSRASRLLCVCVCIVAGTHGALLPTWNSGLVGYYPLDGDVHDYGSLGNRNEEPLDVANYTADAYCPGGMAVELTSDTPVFVHNKSAGFPLGTASFSVSFWIKALEPAVTATFLTVGTQAQKGYKVEYFGNFIFTIGSLSSNVLNWPNFHDQWMHVLITGNTTTFVSFVSGVKAWRDYPIPDATDLVLTMGGVAPGFAVSRNLIDDIKFWDRVVTPEESEPCGFYTTTRTLDTIAPPTQAPDTQAPDTPAPTNASVASKSPSNDTDLGSQEAAGDQHLVNKELGSASAAGSVNVVAGAVGMLTLASPHAALRISLVTRACTRHLGKARGEEEDAYPVAMHPIQATIGGSQDLGAVVYNSLIAFGLYLVFVVVVTVVKHLDLLPATARDPNGYCSYPSVPLFVWQFLYLGITFGAARLVFSPEFPQSEYVGGIVLLVCASLPLLIFRWVTSGVPTHAVYEPAVDPEEAGKSGGGEPRALVWLVGPGEWVSRREEYDWVNRYGSLVRNARPGCAWYAAVECLTSLALACVLATDPSDPAGCGHVRLACSAVFCGRFALDAAVRPFAKKLHTVAEPCLHAVQAAGLALLAAAFYADSQGAFSAGDAVMTAAGALLIAKTVSEGVGEIVVLVRGRRDKLHARVLGRESRLDAASAPPALPYSNQSTGTSDLNAFTRVPSPFSRLHRSSTAEQQALHQTQSPLLRSYREDPLLGFTNQRLIPVSPVPSSPADEPFLRWQPRDGPRSSSPFDGLRSPARSYRSLSMQSLASSPLAARRPTHPSLANSRSGGGADADGAAFETESDSGRAVLTPTRNLSFGGPDSEFASSLRLGDYAASYLLPPHREADFAADADPFRVKSYRKDSFVSISQRLIPVSPAFETESDSGRAVLTPTRNLSFGGPDPEFASSPSFGDYTASYLLPPVARSTSSAPLDRTPSAQRLIPVSPAFETESDSGRAVLTPTRNLSFGGPDPEFASSPSFGDYTASYLLPPVARSTSSAPLDRLTFRSKDSGTRFAVGCTFGYWTTGCNIACVLRFLSEQDREADFAADADPFRVKSYRKDSFVSISQRLIPVSPAFETESDSGRAVLTPTRNLSFGGPDPEFASSPSFGDYTASYLLPPVARSTSSAPLDRLTFRSKDSGTRFAVGCTFGYWTTGCNIACVLRFLSEQDREADFAADADPFRVKSYRKDSFVSISQRLIPVSPAFETESDSGRAVLTPTRNLSFGGSDSEFASSPRLGDYAASYLLPPVARRSTSSAPLDRFTF